MSRDTKHSTMHISSFFHKGSIALPKEFIHELVHCSSKPNLCNSNKQDMKEHKRCRQALFTSFVFPDVLSIVLHKVSFQLFPCPLFPLPIWA